MLLKIINNYSSANQEIHEYSGWASILLTHYRISIATMKPDTLVSLESSIHKGAYYKQAFRNGAGKCFISLQDLRCLSKEGFDLDLIL